METCRGKWPWSLSTRSLIAPFFQSQASMEFAVLGHQYSLQVPRTFLQNHNPDLKDIFWTGHSRWRHLLLGEWVKDQGFQERHMEGIGNAQVRSLYQTGFI